MTDIAHRFELSLPQRWEQQMPTSALTTDVEKMQFVLKLANWNISNDSGGPFAAAIFDSESGELTSIGVNRVVSQNCSLAHAESLAIALAQKRLGTYDLSSAAEHRYELFSSGQPCVQCFGMTWWSGVSRLVIGARVSDIEEITEFREGPLPENWQTKLAQREPLPPVTVVHDVCRDEARSVLQTYVRGGGQNYSPGRQ